MCLLWRLVEDLQIRCSLNWWLGAWFAQICHFKLFQLYLHTIPLAHDGASFVFLDSWLIYRIICKQFRSLLVDSYRFLQNHKGLHQANDRRTCDSHLPLPISLPCSLYHPNLRLPAQSLILVLRLLRGICLYHLLKRGTFNQESWSREDEGTSSLLLQISRNIGNLFDFLHANN